jgi:signal transduction histidine kinase
MGRNNDRINRHFIIALIISVIAGLFCTYFYDKSPEHLIRIPEFKSQLEQKFDEALHTTNELKKKLAHSPVDSLIHYPFSDDDIAYFVFNGNRLVFWSSNQLDVSNITTDTTWHFTQLPNAYCLFRSVQFDSLRIVPVILLKYNYPFENSELSNRFARGFYLDKQIQLVEGSKKDTWAVSDAKGNYLFSFVQPNVPIYNELWATFGFIAFALAFVFFFILYARFSYLLNRKQISYKTFVLLVASVGIILFLCLYFNFPSLLFLNKHFSSFQYASNRMLSSLVHLTVATLFVLDSLYVFRFHVRELKSDNWFKRIFRQIVFALYFGLFYYILSGLIYHSSIQMNILRIEDFSIMSVWAHGLILLWGIGLGLLFFRTHRFLNNKRIIKYELLTDFCISVFMFGILYLYAPFLAINITVWFVVGLLVFYLPALFRSNKNIYSFLVPWILAFTIFVLWNSYIFSEQNKWNKYRILAQNIAINGNTENDRMAEILLEELDVQIGHDRKLPKLIARSDSLVAASNYMNIKYLRGFWNKYDMRLNAARNHSDTYNEYDEFVSSVGKRIKQTHFYIVPANQNNMSYIGVFPTLTAKSDSLTFYMEFYPRRNFKSYSFPNLLIASTSDIQSQMNIGIAKYERGKLVYSSGKVDHPVLSNWIPRKNADFFKFIFNTQINYIYAPNPISYIVITDEQPYRPLDYLFYFIYTFLGYFLLSWLFIRIYKLINHKQNYRIGFTSKFQYSFLLLLIISFIAIFYVSVNFIQEKYRQEQITDLESKKAYIQKALQDMYYWNQDLNASNSQNLNFDLQDLSYIYHTDIHVYDNHGHLIGSSQPIIFNKGLISRRIAPLPMFSAKGNLNQYEDIGNLKYLTGYTDFYNGDYVQIGFIAVPQFFSQDEIQTEIEAFLSVIIHIYLIIIVLAVLISLLIGKQLSAPLIMIENKLKEMRLGQRNEKIDYRVKDEIGQLVAQYNRTLDELEQSARLLARSERETAWKSMARQVAHEINNPLTPMKLTIQQLQRTKNSGDSRFDEYFKKSTSMLIEQIDNLSRIAGTFSNFARMPEAHFERVDIALRLYSVSQLFSNNHESVDVIYEGPENEVWVYADPEQLVQVFNNLLKNALQAIPEERDGVIKIQLSEDENEVQIDISDNGNGIPNEIKDRLFMPNFTTKSNGMGLGLAIAKNIIELSGGIISFVSIHSQGTTFKITIPKN